MHRVNKALKIALKKRACCSTAIQAVSKTKSSHKKAQHEIDVIDSRDTTTLIYCLLW